MKKPKEIKLNKEISIFSDGTVSGASIFEENGYNYFIFEGKRTAVHRIIAQHFLNQGDSIEGLDVHHIDFSRNNNNINNLMILSKHQHIALHRYLETPEGYRQLREDIQTWKDKADYYRRKAQNIEKLNSIMESALKQQIALVAKYKDSIELLNEVYENGLARINEAKSEIDKKIDETTTKTDEMIIVSKHDIKYWCDRCISLHGKVTPKRLRLMGIANFNQVYSYYRNNY